VVGIVVGVVIGGGGDGVVVGVGVVVGGGVGGGGVATLAVHVILHFAPAVLTFLFDKKFTLKLLKLLILALRPLQNFLLLLPDE